VSSPPNLLLFDGDWPTYEERIYKAFMDSFVHANIRFHGWPVKSRYEPATRGKGFSFWHLISESQRPGDQESDRTPDLRRCERIEWVAWAISAIERGVPNIKWWENKRRRRTSIVIWLEEYDYAVILAKRRKYYLLKTAYADIKPHRRKTFQREFEAFWHTRKG